jgi:uncharacterized membrane protein YkoI
MVTAIFAAVAFAVALPADAGDCPAEVISAVQKSHSGAKTLSCHRELEDGATLYEVKIRTEDGKNLKLEIASDGKIIETEEAIPTSEIPAAVLKALQAEHPDAKVREAERVTDANGEVFFEIELTSGGRTQELTITESGSLVESEDDDFEDEADEKDD